MCVTSTAGAREIVWHWTELQGWDDDTLLDLMMAFLDQMRLGRSLDHYLAGIARAEPKRSRVRVREDRRSNNTSSRRRQRALSEGAGHG